MTKVKPCIILLWSRLLPVVLGKLIYLHFLLVCSFFGKRKLKCTFPKNMVAHYYLGKYLSNGNKAYKMLLVIFRRYFSRNKIDWFWLSWFHSMTTCLPKLEVSRVSTWVRVPVSCLVLITENEPIPGNLATAKTSKDFIFLNLSLHSACNNLFVFFFFPQNTYRALMALDTRHSIGWWHLVALASKDSMRILFGSFSIAGMAVDISCFAQKGDK